MNIKNIIPISQARKDIFTIAKKVQKAGQRFILTENGHPKLVVLSASEFESLTETVEILRAFPNIDEEIEEAQQEYKSGEFKTLDEVLKDEGYVKANKKS